MTDESANFTNDDAVEASAATWLVEREEGLSPEREAAFIRWRDSDARHAAAIARLKTTDRLLKNLPQLRDDPRLSRRLEAMMTPRRGRVLRFPVIRTLAAAAAIALAGAYLWFSKTETFEQSYATVANATRVSLPDGSFVEMKNNSDIRVKFTPQTRDVALVQGEAHFTVAKDASRPFVVAAGRIKVRAVGTAFNVRMEEYAVKVLVTEGKVQVSRASLPENPGADELISSLTAGEGIEIQTGTSSAISQAQAKGIERVPQVSASPSSRLVGGGQSLAKVVEEFNRRNQIQLVLGDAEIWDRPIGGTFQSDDVETFVRALENTGEISAERTNNSTIVLRKGN